MITLIGIDPGIVDTGLVALSLDPASRRLVIDSKVWTDVTTKHGQSIKVDEKFLQHFSETLDAFHDKPNVFIEGYRSRGKNIVQDRKMTVLVHALQEAAGECKVVDNTGVRKVVKEGLLALMHINRWSATNHADLKSAARIAVKGALEDKDLNVVIADYVRDTLKGDLWTITRR